MTTLRRIDLIEIGTLVAFSSGGSGSTHDPVTVIDTTSINLTLAGQALSAEVIAGGHDHDAAYAAISHGHAIADVADLQTTLDAKLTEGDISDLNEHMVTGQEGSIAVGLDATVGAAGINKSAFGANSEASGDRATAAGQSARALAPDAVALGWNALVPVDAVRSGAIGADATPPPGMTDVLALRYNDLILVRSDGITGGTRYGILSSDGVVHWMSITSEGLLVVDGQTVGTEGAPGEGVPPGGIVGQVLAKATDLDYETEWIAPPAGGSGGGTTHDPVTVTDTSSIDLTLTGQTVKADVTLDGHTQGIATVTGLQMGLDARHVKGGTDVPIADGGTGASTAPVALTNLGAAAAADLTTHTANVANPHVVTKAQVGLANVDNTSDLAKPVSTAVQAALAAKAPLAHHHAVPWQPGGYYSSISFPGLGKQSTLDTQLVINRHYAVPFYSPGGAITALGVQITTAVAGSIRLFVYSMGADGKPATYLVGTANLSTSAIGGVEGAVTYTFPAPGWYYLVCVASAAVTLRFFIPMQSPLGQPSPGSSVLVAMYSKDEASTSPTSSFGAPSVFEWSFAPIISVKAA